MDEAANVSVDEALVVLHRLRNDEYLSWYVIERDDDELCWSQHTSASDAAAYARRVGGLAFRASTATTFEQLREES